MASPFFKVRRLVYYPEGQQFQFARVLDDNHGRVELEWVDMWEDGTALSHVSAANVREHCRAVNQNLNVISHAIVPCQ